MFMRLTPGGSTPENVTDASCYFVIVPTRCQALQAKQRLASAWHLRSEAMDIEKVLALYDREQRIEIEYPGMKKQVLPHVVRFLRPAPAMSFILYSQMDDSNAAAVIEEQVTFIKGRQQPFEWKIFSHDQPADLPQRLTAHGFESEEMDAVMVLDLSEAPGPLLQEPGADIRRITQRDELGDVITILEKVWGGNFSWVTHRLGDHLEIPGYLSIYVAYVDDEPACTGWTYFHPNSHFASIWGGSTVEEYRQNGLYTAVLARRVQEALARGYSYVTMDASPMSRPIVTKNGFEILTYSQSCKWIPEDH